jgi:hypothetical protein
MVLVQVNAKTHACLLGEFLHQGQGRDWVGGRVQALPEYVSSADSGRGREKGGREKALEQSWLYRR